MIKTGFIFMDELNSLNSGDLISIQGNCMQTEQFVISLMQSILDRNDGYVLLLQKRNFDYFTGSIFNEYLATSDNALVKDRISKDRILPRGSLFNAAELLQKSLSAWLGMDKFKHLQDKKLLAIVTPIYKLRHDITEEEATLVLKDAAQILNVPVICWQKDSSDILFAADITFKLKAEHNYQEPIDIEVIKQPGNKTFRVRANKSSLKYAERLKNNPKLGCGEEMDNEQ